MTLGETIGEENPDIRGDMQEACRESRNVCSGLEKLCESLSHTVIGNSGVSNNHVKNSPNHLRRTKSSMQSLGVTQESWILQVVMDAKDTQCYRMVNLRHLKKGNTIGNFHDFNQF